MISGLKVYSISALLILAALLGSSQNLFAIDEDSLSELRLEHTRQILQQFDSMFAGSSDKSGRGTSHSVYSSNMSQDNLCDPAQENCNDPKKFVRPSAKMLPVGPLIHPPFHALANQLWDTKVLRATMDNLHNKHTLAMLTLAYTQPTVFNTVAKVTPLVAKNVRNHLLAEIGTARQIEQMPAGEVFYEAYVRCLDEEMSRHRSLFVIPGQESPTPVSFTAAQEYCRRDSITASPVVDPGTPTEGLFSWHPAFDVEDYDLVFTDDGAGGEVATFEEDEIPGSRISLVGMIFNDQISSTPGLLEIAGKFYPIYDSSHVVKQLRNDFLDKYGDLRSEFDVPLIDPPPPADGEDPIEGPIGLEAHYRVIEPRIKPSYNYMVKIHKKFHYLRFVLGWYCNYLNDVSVFDFDFPALTLQIPGIEINIAGFIISIPGITFSLQSYVDAELPFHDTEETTRAFRDFFNYAYQPWLYLEPTGSFPFITPDLRKILDKQGFEELSLRGAPWTQVHFQLFFDEVRNFAKVPGEDSYECSQLNFFHLISGEIFDAIKYLIGPLRNPLTNEAILPTPIEQYIEDVVKPANNGTIPDLFPLMYYISEHIALGEIIDEARIASQILLQLSSQAGSAVPEALVNEALSLISKNVGIDVADLDMAMFENNQRVLNLINLLMTRREHRNQQATN